MSTIKDADEGLLYTVSQRPRIAEAPSSSSCTIQNVRPCWSSCSWHSDFEFSLLFWTLGIFITFFWAQLSVKKLYYIFYNIYIHLKQKNIHLIQTSCCQKLSLLRGYVPKHFTSHISILFILCEFVWIYISEPIAGVLRFQASKYQYILLCTSYFFLCCQYPSLISHSFLYLQVFLGSICQFLIVTKIHFIKQ